MSAKIALQLYSIRDEMQKDYEGSLKKIAAMGYTCVEVAGYYGNSPQEAAQLLKKYHLTPCSMHIFPPALEDRVKETLDLLKIFDCKHYVSGFGPDQFKNLEEMKKSCDILNHAYDLVSKEGISLSVHNHWWEYTLTDGVYPYRVMLEQLNPAINFEVDVYWARTAGVDPVKAIKEADGRTPLIHIKDGPAAKDVPMTAVGDGVVDITAIVNAYKDKSQYLIVEIDACATDMMEAVKKSYQYLDRLM